MEAHSSAGSTAHGEQQQLRHQAACVHASTNQLICSDSCVFNTCQHGVINMTPPAFAAGSDSICGQNNGSTHLKRLMTHAEAIGAELSALLPEAGFCDAVLPTKTVTTAESGPAGAAHVNSTTGAAAAAAAIESDSAGAARVNNSTGAAILGTHVSRLRGAGASKRFSRDQPPTPVQLPSHVSSSTLRTAEQQRGVIDSLRNRLAVTAATTSYQGPLGASCPGVTAQLGTSTTAAAHHELLNSNQSDSPNSSRSSSSSGGSSMSVLTPGAPGSNSLRSSGPGSGTTLSCFIAKLLVSAVACKAQHHRQQQQQQQLLKGHPTAPVRLHLPLLNPAAVPQIAAEPITRGNSQAAISMQVASVHTQQPPAPHAATLAAETVGLRCLRVITPAQTAMQQQLQQQQGSNVMMSRPGAQPTAAVSSQLQSTPATAVAAVANMHQRAVLCKAGVAGGYPLGVSPLGCSPLGSSPLGAASFGGSEPLGGSPLGRQKRRSSESTQFDVAWPSQQQQQQEPGWYEVSANCSGVSKLESGIVIPATKKAKIDAEGLLTRMSAVVASVYDAAAANRAVTAAHAELWRHGYMEAR